MTLIAKLFTGLGGGQVYYGSTEERFTVGDRVWQMKKKSKG